MQNEKVVKFGRYIYTRLYVERRFNILYNYLLLLR